MHGITLSEHIVLTTARREPPRRPTAPWRTLSHRHGCVTTKDVLTIHVGRDKLAEIQPGVVAVHAGMTSDIHVIARAFPENVDGLYPESHMQRS